MNTLSRRNPLEAIAAARELLDLPAAIVETVDNIAALNAAAAAVTYPAAPANPTPAELAADPLACAAAAIAHEHAIDHAKRAAKMCGERSTSLRSLGLDRELERHGQALILGPIRAKVAELLDDARQLVPVLDEYDRDPAHVASHGTPDALEAWQDYQRLQHDFDVVVAMWGVLMPPRLTRSGGPGPFGGPAAWARPELVAPEHRGTYPPGDGADKWVPVTTDLLNLADQPRATGFRLYTLAELEAIDLEAERARATGRKPGQHTHRAVVLR
ncbi:MAG: hypothetical protein ACT4QF_00260 [Sporichthyaceae bacterium]